VLDSEENYLGDALGQLYVAKYFSPRTKQRYEKLTDEIFDAFRVRITNLAWMSAPTKQRALKKLNSVVKKGRLSRGLEDLCGLRRRSNVGAGERSARTHVAERRCHCQASQAGRSSRVVDDAADLQCVLQPVKQRNRPAGRRSSFCQVSRILSSTMRSSTHTRAGRRSATRSRMASTIRVDSSMKKGNLTDWWTAEDAKEFNRRAAGVVKQYGQYIAVKDIHINGSATQGENIADIGGIALAWDAFTKTPQYKAGKADRWADTGAAILRWLVARLDEPAAAREPRGAR
jgi:putative endopeptidase